MQIAMPVEDWKHDYISISFIRLSSTKEKNSKHQLINMLATLFSEELSAEGKKKILEKEHQMQMTRELEGGIHAMCNVSQGIKERAFAQGIERGEKQMLSQQIRKKFEKNFSLEAIAEALEINVETVHAIVAEYKM